MPKRLLDTYCKAGGASKGYADAGFEVVGVDIEPQDNYPYEFHQGDAIDFIRRHGHKFDVIAGSPPCQGYSVSRHTNKRTEYSMLIEPTREAMRATGRPYVIENVEGARLHMDSPATLCGSAFGLRVRRHRLFETNWGLIGPPCDHAWQNASKCYVVRMSRQTREGARLSGTVPVFGSNQLLFDGVGNNVKELEACSEAMGIWWMTKAELNQAIPPAYTRYIGEHLIKALEQ
jgi:DNA (cytosine-5)-methyltransferase 1